MKKKVQQYFRELFRGPVIMNEPLSRHTSFRIGGPADFYFYPKDLEDLAKALFLCQEEAIPWFVIGNGTNLLVSDNGFRGLVIDVSQTFRTLYRDGNRVTVGSGVLLSELLSFLLHNALSGFEHLAGIPGQIGGVIRLNAGAFGTEVGDCLTHVSFMDAQGQIHTKSRSEIHMGYRTIDLPSPMVIFEAQFQFTEGKQEEMEAKQNEILSQRGKKQPLSFPSAGSVFKRPPGDFAGRLIEQAGLKGLRKGDAEVSQKHANFIVNLGTATAQDVVALIFEIQQRVEARFGIFLEPELHFLGFDASIEARLFRGGK